MSPSALALQPAPGPAPAAPARVDIVVPVFDEQAILARSVRRLHDHLTHHMPFHWRIVIVDNASTDQTALIAGGAGDRPAARRAPAAATEGPRPRAARRLAGQRR
jgi:hypothetical protein